MGEICPIRCPLDGASLTPASVPAVIRDLAEREVSPDTFHCEDRALGLATLGACTPPQVSLFRDLQTSLADRIGSMSTPQIADNLRRLYDRAYRYDPATRTMDVADRRTKRELDLWIAVIDRQAFEDESFLDRILERPQAPNQCLEAPVCEDPVRSEASRDIEIVMALNSPNLSPSDRGAFHRLHEGSMTWEDAAREGDEIFSKWLSSYDGRTPFLETPLWRSQAELYAASAAWLGQERLQEIGRETFSQERFAALARRLGMEREVASLQGLSDQGLMARLQDLYGVMAGKPGSELMRGLVRETFLGNMVLTARGGDYMSRFREMWIQTLVTQSHFSPDEAELFVGPLGAGAPNMTASRLDNYQRRFQFLSKFRDLYREFLTTPVTDRFSRERMSRFNLWGQQILNGGRMMGAPIAMEDLDRIRREVQRGVGVATSGPLTWDQFVSRDVRQPLLIRPEDLGGAFLPAGSCSEPLALASDLTVNGRALSDVLRENVEFVAVLPPELVPADHAAGLAYGLFGVVILNGQEWRAGHNPSAGYFWRTLAHEVAGHEVWARSQFDEHPERLMWLGANERYAYTVGRAAVHAYVQTGCVQADELRQLNYMEETDTTRIEISNRRLGLPPNDMGSHLMAEPWVGRPLQDFMFQPGNLLGQDGREVPDPLDEFRSLSPQVRNHLVTSSMEAVAVGLGLNLQERRVVTQTLASLRALRADQVSATFTADHPFLRVFNRIKGLNGMPPLEHASFSRSSWEQWQLNLLGTIRVAERRSLAESRQRQQDARDWERLSPMAASFWDSELERLDLEGQVLLEEALDQAEHADAAHPLVLPSTHPLVRITNRFLEEQDQAPLREIRVTDAASWQRLQLFFLRSYESQGTCIEY